MTDGRPREGDGEAGSADAADADAGAGGDAPSVDDAGPSTDGERERPSLDAVTEDYDFEDFGPADMDEMTAAEWEVAFDPDSWVTGPELLDRVERDLAARIERRDVFAVVERETRDEVVDDAGDSASTGAEERLVAYADEGYAAVYEDGSVEGEGTVLRDVKPSVALCSMPDYEVPEPAGDGTLPDPEAVETGGGELGNLVLLTVGGVQVLAGVVLLVAWVVRSLPILALVFALLFLGVGAFLVVVVANARLAARFRSSEYRDRLRSVGAGGAGGAVDGGTGGENGGTTGAATTAGGETEDVRTDE
ncbi:MAG: hypothetical protein ABEJ42_02645 [Halobacteriaceae archaeon]